MENDRGKPRPPTLACGTRGLQRSLTRVRNPQTTQAPEGAVCVPKWQVPSPFSVPLISPPNAWGLPVQPVSVGRGTAKKGNGTPSSTRSWHHRRRGVHYSWGTDWGPRVIRGCSPLGWGTRPPPFPGPFASATQGRVMQARVPAGTAGCQRPSGAIFFY